MASHGTEDPAVSVVIAAYNAESTLDAQLDALQRQVVDFAWEVLVCDNGSTDDTAGLVRRRRARMPQLRLVDASARRGPAAARNVGARAARGSILLFCDADDVVADDWLPLMHATLTTESFASGTSRRRELNSRPENPTFFDWSLYRMPYFPHLDGAGAGNLGIRRDIFVDVGGFDESLRTGEDLDLCWRVQLAGHRLVANDQAVVHVSNREGLSASITQAYAYGVGDRRLSFKYARIADAYRRRESRDGPNSEPTAVDPRAAAQIGGEGVVNQPAPGRLSRLRGVAGKIFRLRRASDLTEAATKAATAIGFRFGRIDRSAEQVEPPGDLAELP